MLDGLGIVNAFVMVFLLIIKDTFIFMCMSVWPTPMSVFHICVWYPRKLNEGVGSQGS